MSQGNGTVKPVVKLVNAGLHEVNGEIVAHGWLSIDAMGGLKIDDYQREVLARTGGKTNLQKAVEEDAILPDVVLGMRGESFSTHGTAMTLNDHVYIIDGLQRIFTLRSYAEAHPEKADNLRIGAEVRFGTTRDAEKELFHALNVKRTPMSPNVTLRNEREKNKAILTLYGLSVSDEASPLHGRVQWTQRRNRGELITALILARTVSMMHRHVGGGLKTGLRDIAADLDKKADTIGLRQFRENILAFFDLIDECWGLRKVEFRQTATQVRGNFMLSLSRILSDHTNFWDKNKFVVDTATRKKLASFPLFDPEMGRLAAAGSTAMPILYNYMREHLNKGKRVNRLVDRKEPASKDMKGK